MKKTDKFNSKQLMCINLMAIGQMSLKEIAKEITVSQNTLTKWKRSSVFMDSVIEKSRESLRGALPQIYISIVAKAKGGSYPHQKLILDHISALESARAECTSNSISFTWNMDDNCK